MTPADFHAHAMAAADDAGRLPLSRMTEWQIFPFERDGLRVVPLRSPEVPEPPRAGEDGRDCRACATPREPLWSDKRWRLSVFPEQPSGAPLILMLEPHSHYDLPDLPDDMAAELGTLTVHITRAIECLPHIARAHVSRWGDGAEHLHVFFIARPAGFLQFRGTCMAVWDDLLPPVPAELRDTDADQVAHAIAASYGGQPTATRLPRAPA
jgi:hypothetical protein